MQGLEDANKSISQLHLQVAGLEQKANAAERNAEQQQSSLRSELRHQTDTIKRFELQNGELQQQLKESNQKVDDLAGLQTELKELSESRRATEDRNAELLQTIDGLKQERSSLNKVVDQLDKLQTEYETACEEADQLRLQIVELSYEVEEFESVREDLARASDDLRTAQAEHDTLTQEVEKLSAATNESQKWQDEASQLQRQLLSTQDDLSKKTKAVEHLKGLYTKTRSELTEAVEEHLDTARRLESQSEMVAELQQKSGQHESIAKELDDLRGQLSETTSHLQRVSEDYNKALDDNQEAEQRITDLQCRLSESADTIRRLRREQGQPVADGSQPNIVSFQQSGKAA